MSEPATGVVLEMELFALLSFYNCVCELKHGTAQA